MKNIQIAWHQWSCVLSPIVNWLESVCLKLIVCTLFWPFIKMSQKLWVKYGTDKERDIGRVSFKDCECVADFIKQIGNEAQYHIPKKTYITLYGASGTAIKVDEPISSLLPGNSSENPLRVQFSALPLVPTKLDSDVELTSFWNSLREIPNKDGFLYFPIRPCFFPTHMKTIYIRKAYEDLFTLICNNLHPENPEKRLHRITITGTPGIGKSVFLFYILWRLANEKGAKTVVLCRESDNGRIYVFQNDGCWRTHEFWDVEKFLEDPSSWYLTDSTESRPAVVDATTIWVVPFRSRLRMWLKYNHCSSPYYLPVWSLEELEMTAFLYSRDLQLVKERYTLIGGIPRFVLERMNDLKGNIRRAISVLAVNRLFEFVSNAGYDESKIGHFIVHCLVDPTYSKDSLMFSSKYVISLALKELLESQNEELKNFLRTKHLDLHGSLRADLFEYCAHRLLTAGGKFIGRSLDDGAELEVIVPRRNAKLFDYLSECTDPDTYYMSRCRNSYYIDSVVSNEGCFRMTMTEENDVSEEEIMKVIKELKTRKLYFVVPDGIFNEFKRQRLVSTTVEQKGSQQEQILDEWAEEEQKMGKRTCAERCSSSAGNPHGDEKLSITDDRDDVGFRTDFLQQYVLCIPTEKDWENTCRVLESTYGTSEEDY